MSIPSEFTSLIESYFVNRIQCVQIKGHTSNLFSQNSGVPLGSIVKSLFFIVLINDIGRHLKANFLIYADHPTLQGNQEYSRLYNRTSLKYNPTKISSWCQNNNLDLNASKCQVLSFTRRQSIIVYDYQLHNAGLCHPDFIKDLSATFDPKLTFVPHIRNTISSYFKTLGFITRNMKEFSIIDTCNPLFNSLVVSTLEYACVVQSPIYNTHTSSLKRAQRRFLKNLYHYFFGRYPPRGFSEDRLLQFFEINNLRKRRTVHLIKFLYKLRNYTTNFSDLLAKINLYLPPFFFWTWSNHLGQNEYIKSGSLISHMQSSWNEYGSNLDNKYLKFKIYFKYNKINLIVMPWSLEYSSFNCWGRLFSIMQYIFIRISLFLEIDLNRQYTFSRD